MTAHQLNSARPETFKLTKNSIEVDLQVSADMCKQKIPSLRLYVYDER